MLWVGGNPWTDEDSSPQPVRGDSARSLEGGRLPSCQQDCQLNTALVPKHWRIE